MRILVVTNTEGIRDVMVSTGETDHVELNIDMPEDTDKGREEVIRRMGDYYANVARSFATSAEMMIFPKDEVQLSMRFFMGYPPFTKKEDIEELYNSDGKLLTAKELANGYADTCDDWFPDDAPPMFVEWAEEVLNEVRRA